MKYAEERKTYICLKTYVCLFDKNKISQVTDDFNENNFKIE